MAVGVCPFTGVMWPRLVLLLLGLVICGSAQLLFKEIESVEYNNENKTILIPCFSTNMEPQSLAELFVTWTFGGKFIFSYNGERNTSNRINEFSSAHITPHELFVGNASLIMDLRHAVPGIYTCEVLELSRGGITRIELKLGPSLKCYSCFNPAGSCKVKNCTVYFNACLYIKAKKNTYYKCWKFENCNYKYISKDLRQKTLRYECCKKNLCNKVKRSHGGKRITGAIALLVTPLLIAFWRLLI